MRQLIPEFLGELEMLEARLLSWALVDGYFAEEELNDLAGKFLARHELDEDPREWIRVMVENGHLFQWTEYDGDRYRTRMAESLRLLARLKQLFPNRPWRSAPNLVSDFRFILRPRRYPKRESLAVDCLQEWTKALPNLTSLQKTVLKALTKVEAGEEGMKLASFQTESTARILREADAPATSATMVCAGTGSGKTLAFYLPALARLAGSIEADPSAWTRALAIYPRKELLKDQMNETLRQTRLLNPVLGATRLRPLVIGSFFGATPYDANSASKSWRRHGDGYVCPFLGCPGDRCSGELIWKKDDLDRGTERLSCNKCSQTISEKEIRLTRRSATASPPDILFTTAEMMNQRLSDKWSWHLFGVGLPPAKRPSLVLLDEAHTYAGNQGAQIAYLLRRWLYRTQAQPHFVGLSATLMEAAAFFSRLTGVPASRVLEISPATAEMESEGMEYMVALRGDPVSGAGLLSTTIQTAMLMRRVLDVAGGKDSGGTCGRKVFVFTDDLDVNNRLYYDLQNAEGLTFWGRVRGDSLAALRALGLGEEDIRFRNGQSWRLSDELGHDLERGHLALGRVSSLDAGVDAQAEVIIATASLEVGFNDSAVGVVLQHKAPRDAASFLQRKGRAGRSRLMRPWTVLVLSDFGRDRLAYQGHDLIFDPELRPRDLPLSNRHVLKMQAVHSMMDWISRRLDRGHFWKLATGPASNNANEKLQLDAAAIVAGILEGGDSFDQFRDWLRGSLKLDDDDVLQLLWGPPRALMTGVLPTLHRRLATGWLRGSRAGTDYQHRHPLPEFIAGTLFGDLNLPEVAVIAGVSTRSMDTETHAMPIAQALREFAPGKISKRYAVNDGNLRHWIPLDHAGPQVQDIEVRTFCAENSSENLGVFQIEAADGTVRDVPVLRPFAFNVRHDAAQPIRDSSNAMPRWHSQILPPLDAKAGEAIDLPDTSRWTPVIGEIRFFVHRFFEPATIRRFTTGSEATVQMSGSTLEVSTHFMAGTSEVALGFSFEADALRFLIHIPDDWKLQGEGIPPEKLHSLRPARLRWRMENEEALRRHGNIFEIGHLAEMILAAISAVAVMEKLKPQQAWTALRSASPPLDLTRVPDDIFQTVPNDTDPQALAQSQRIINLRQMLGNADVLGVIDQLVPELWAEPGEQWKPWLSGRYLSTLAAAIRDAIQQICPDADVESLAIDLEPGPGRDGAVRSISNPAELWISEDTPGGGGIVERLLPLVAENPQRFLDLVQGALGPSDFEACDHELDHLLKMLAGPEPVDATIANAVAVFRSASTMREVTANFQSLVQLLRDRGFRTTHVVLTALNARILKPGGNPATDRVLADLIRAWKTEEARLGMEIDARSFAYAMSGTPVLDQALGLSGQQERSWRLGSLYSLMWPRGSQARNHALVLHHRYSASPRPERLLVTDLLGPGEPSVEFGADGWRRECERCLLAERRIRLICPAGLLGRLRQELVSLLVRPIDAGSILLYPRLRGIDRELDTWTVLLDIVAPGQIVPDSEAEEDAVLPRLIVKTGTENRDEIRDMLESLFAIELLSPTRQIWIVSPWLTDLPLLDNRSGAYSGLEPSWPKRHITLTELLVHALRTNPDSKVRIVTRPVEHNLRFLDRIRHLASLEGHEDRVVIDGNREDLHTKGIATEDFALIGSMNLTHNGIAILEETVQLTVEPMSVSQFLISLNGHYGS